MRGSWVALEEVEDQAPLADKRVTDSRIGHPPCCAGTNRATPWLAQTAAPGERQAPSFRGFRMRRAARSAPRRCPECRALPGPFRPSAPACTARVYSRFPKRKPSTRAARMEGSASRATIRFSLLCWKPKLLLFLRSICFHVVASIPFALDVLPSSQFDSILALRTMLSKSAAK